MASLANVFNHLVLPPKIPGSQDSDIESTSNDVLARLIQATITLGRLAGQEQASTWQALRQSLFRCQSLHMRGRLEKRALILEFQCLKHDQPLILHILEQNAALIVRRVVSDKTEVVVFEAFETSPPSAEVLACQGALIWDFPGCAAQIPLVEFQKSTFQEALAEFLEKGSMEPLRCFQVHTTKAQTSIVESRDTSNPALVTTLLIPMLEAIGSVADSNVPRMRKRVRDDANIAHSEFPWRRLPFWLVLRVFTQRQLQLTHGVKAGRAYYKFLITVMLAEFLDKCPRELAPELTMTLRAKICRRLAKLEQETEIAPAVYDYLFAMTSTFLKDIITSVTNLVDLAWEKYKRETARRIPRLALRAEEQALYLSLPNSGEYLQDVLSLPHTQSNPNISWNLPSLHDSAIEQVGHFTNLYFNLADLEAKIETGEVLQSMTMSTHESRCTKLAEAIFDLFRTVDTAYDSNPEQMSIFILNLFTLWVWMDENMTQSYPLLLDYHPVFTPELLDALHLPTTSGMQRLRDIQMYIQNRCQRCIKQTTIFTQPGKQDFAVKYVSQSPAMRTLLEKIQTASESSRQAKEAELGRWCEEYDEHSLGITGGTCQCTFDHSGARQIRGCDKCWHWRARKRMAIYAHEDFLPKKHVKAATIVFELGIPRSIASYRHATWKIFKLAYPSKPTPETPLKLLENYEPLIAHGKGSVTGITLASTSKSFLGTHYKVAKRGMRATESDVIFPNGLDFLYFDTASNAWIKDFKEPLTFQHLCGIHVPPGLRNSVMMKLSHPPTDIHGPSSYEIVASGTKCPSNMSVQEFTAYQRLLSGKNRRWLTMLVELGASDLNFSDESTMHMFNHLATQAGPAQNESGVFRDTHAVFTDPLFCDRLAEQVEARLHSISSNWREVHCMEILITLSLRLFSLAHCKTLPIGLLKKARDITLQWIARLRTDVRSATEASIPERAARHAFWAALLCRRTFYTFTESEEMLPADDLAIFVQASLALQENLLIDLAKLSPLLRSMLIRDTKMAYNLRSLIKRSIAAFPQSIGEGINASWSSSGDSTGKVFGEWRTLTSPHDRWMVSAMSATTRTSANSQVVHYNFIEGHLLVDGKPLGRLPRNIRESDDVKDLFGNQHLLTFPSPEVGMSYALVSRIDSQEIHFGIRKGRVVIRARSNDGLLEYIPHQLFKESGTVDLPLSLVDNCTHWLNLRTKCIEVRRKPCLWRTRPSDWIIDVVHRHGCRSKRTALVDPNSDLFKRVADIFRHFEEPHKITVFQPIHGGHMSVELRHLELSFYVSQKGLLRCKELREEIDPDQDAGSLYGLRSKIVLRDIKDHKRRSIIVPWGTISYERHGMHVAICAASSTEYARFGIDDVLGQLSCPPEPRLLYAKAQFHAFTSFVIPDPLTGRTGTEEALHVLQLGYCQPWTPLGKTPIDILNTLKQLSPRREYYPKNKKNLQSTAWDPKLTMTIQHDGFDGLVQQILCKSAQLRVFAPNNDDARVSTCAITYLRKRGIAQRGLYERSNPRISQETGGDNLYRSRGQQAPEEQARNVYHIARMLLLQSFSIHTSRKLFEILQDWSLIGGFHTTSEIFPASMSDVIEKNIDEQWGSLVNACRRSGPRDLYSLMFRLCLMVLNSKIDTDAIKILAAIASLSELKTLKPPSCRSFNQFKFKESPDTDSLFRVISVDLPEKKKKWVDKEYQVHQAACEEEGWRLAQHFLGQWPNEEVLLDDFKSDLIDTGLAMERVVPEWHRLHENRELSNYVTRAQEVLECRQGPNDKSRPKAWKLTQTPSHKPKRNPVVPSVPADLLIKSLASPLDVTARESLVLYDNSHTALNIKSTEKTQTKETVELRNILSSFTSSFDTIRKQYGCDLQMSLAALEKTNSQRRFSYVAPSLMALEKMIKEIRTNLEKHFVQIRDALSTNDSRFQWLDLANLWPCNTSMALLEQLRSSSNHIFGANVKETIVLHGILVTELQRLIRIRTALYHGRLTRLQEELENRGHKNWIPLQFPDWLLLEIDSDIMIREEQIDVAHAIIAPASRQNAVVQLNMGKGKTSCIVPMAVAILGNGQQLSRLITPKPLLLPTAQMIQSRIGGLVGREIRHIPFSRRTKSNPETLQVYMELHQEILCQRGVVLNAPEHILSFKLSGLQHLASSDLKIAREMINFQSWLNTTCRDVLDESDVSLAVKTQLIYPSGKQTTVDGHPHRWQVIESLLSLVRDHIWDLQHKYPRGIEIIERDHGYPMMHFLQSDVEDELHRIIVNKICTGNTTFLRFANSNSSSTPSNHADIGKILLDADFDAKLFERVASLFADKVVASKILLLVRGLLLNRILLLCLKKRWNVQYGIHPRRDPIAVPFEAKGVPSEQAEFGHPDVAILFTCLAFYYAGLDQNQLCQGLRYILSSHDPSGEFDRWTSDCKTLPTALCHWNTINMDDPGQLEELWKHLRTSRSVLDHYMNHFVFPAHAKQFSIKLQASGWDLPLFLKMSPNDNIGTVARTTGFSGTNDNKMMLPLTIRQDDLPSLHQTNAEVLTYLLQDRNRGYHLASQGGKRWSERELLKQLELKQIRVLIDAGAYILEMSNEALVNAWLAIDTQPQAAVYFGADNRALVQYRGMKAPVPLLATSFLDNLDNCLVYLDEAHTRGIDLKLPQEAHGALTLALGQTKDHTVQAAMRLRQLATTQSLSFFAYPETHQSILDVCKVNDQVKIDSSHVIHWLLEQTCHANEQLHSLYVSRGADFCNRTTAEWENAAFLSDLQDRDALVKVLQHPEQQTLEQLYGNHTNYIQRESSPMSSFPQIQTFIKELNKRRRDAASNPKIFHSSALDEVEQEREVEFQVEEVREVQRPAHHEALGFPGIHPAISNFVQKGVLDGKEGYEHVSIAMSRTSVGQKFSYAATSQLFASAELMRTIKMKRLSSIDNFLRPVEWILYCPCTYTALILIAEEAELLIPNLRTQSNPPKVHLLIYSAPVTKKMLHFSTLTYYAIPALPDGHVIPTWLTIELGIFAGRLYMGFEECAPLVKYIENVSKERRSDESATDMVRFLIEWISLRRKGQDIMHTPMGYICQGTPLHREHAFFVTHRVGNIVATEMRLDEEEIASEEDREIEEIEEGEDE